MAIPDVAADGQRLLDAGLGRAGVLTGWAAWSSTGGSTRLRGATSDPLGLWMRVVGVNPASPVLFAIVMYALAVVTLVAVFGRNRTRAAGQALHLGVAALSFSPMLVYAAVFGLKDVFFTTLVVLMTVAFLTLLVGAAWTHTTRSTNLLAAAVGIAAMGLIAGTRVLLDPSVGSHCGDVCRVLHDRRAGAPARAAAQAAIALPMLALAIAFCAEGNYPRFVWSLIVRVPEAVVEHQTPIPIDGVEELDRRRKAIEEHGGNSMLIRPREKAGSASLHKEKAGSPVFPLRRQAPPASRGDDRLRQSSRGDGGRRPSRGNRHRAGRRPSPQRRHREVGGHRPPRQHGGAARSPTRTRWCSTCWPR